jgi:hypothetical protein
MLSITISRLVSNLAAPYVVKRLCLLFGDEV